MWWWCCIKSKVVSHVSYRRGWGSWTSGVGAPGPGGGGGVLGRGGSRDSPAGGALGVPGAQGTDTWKQRQSNNKRKTTTTILLFSFAPRGFGILRGGSGSECRTFGCPATGRLLVRSPWLSHSHVSRCLWARPPPPPSLLFLISWPSRG